MSKTFLHVGCGTSHKEQTTFGFNKAEWNEIRLDLNPKVEPDIVSNILDMSSVQNQSVDAVFSSHNIEHLFPYQVRTALEEFKRVLKQDGFLVLTCPNIKALGTYLTEDKVLDPLYESESGSVSPIDILYGFRPSLAAGNHFMAHKCGFTINILKACLRESGFISIAIFDRAKPFFDIWSIATVEISTDSKLRQLATEHFPSVNN